MKTNTSERQQGDILHSFADVVAPLRFVEKFGYLQRNECCRGNEEACENCQ